MPAFPSRSGGGLTLARILGRKGASKPAAGRDRGRRPASLEWTVTSRIALIFIVLGIATFFLARALTMRKFQDLERRDLLACTRHVFQALNMEAATLEPLVSLSARREDIRANLHRPSHAFLERNFSAEWAAVNDIDFVLLVTRDGRRTWSSSGTPGFVPALPAGLTAERFAPDDPVLFRLNDGGRPVAGFSGLAGLGDQVWIYCVRAVTGPESGQHARGLLVFGRRLSRTKLASYAFWFGEALTLVPVDQLPPPGRNDDAGLVRDWPAFGGMRTAVRRERATYVSYTPLVDVRGRPLAVLRLAMPRRDERAGVETLHILETIRLVSFVLGLGLVLLVVRSTVVVPVKRLASFFTARGKGQEAILRRGARRGDEIGILAGRALAMVHRIREQNALLERQANTDRLTGLPNRRMLEAHLDQEVRRLLRARRTRGGQVWIAVAMADVDHFKRYNDTYGHMAGDVCLKAVADSIQACIARPGDLASRFGGEEFLVVLPDTDLAGARQVAEAVRERVAELALPHRSSPVCGVVTVSVGVAVAEVTEALSLEALVERADQALYRAKEAGRNRVAADTGAVPAPVEA